MKLVPLGDRVVLKQKEAEDVTETGIILTAPDKEKPQQAEIIAVGPGREVNGKAQPMNVSVGQQVIFSKYAGTTVEIDGEEYIIAKQDDILAIVED